jgi:hypothetical protein
MAVIQRFEDLYPTAFRDYLTQQDVAPDIAGKLATSPEVTAILEEFSNSEPDPIETMEMPR